jgi:hypothetical protein
MSKFRVLLRDVPTVAFVLLAGVIVSCGTQDSPLDDVSVTGDTSVGTECLSSTQCSDDDPCTRDECDRGYCKNTAMVCDDQDLCTADSCAKGKCVFKRTPNCCMTSADCDDGDPCTLNDRCGGDNLCIIEAPIDPCCRNNKECDDGDVCTTDTCQTNFMCFSRWEITTANTGVCCTVERDCVDGDSCTRDKCVMSGEGVHGRCAFEVLCCQLDSDCTDTTSPCMEGVCDTGSGSGSGECTYEKKSGCCIEVGDCDDVPCKTKTCENQLCVYKGVPGCCVADLDCGDDCLVCDKGDAATGICGLSGQAGCCQTVVFQDAFNSIANFTVQPLDKIGYATSPTWLISNRKYFSEQGSLSFGDFETGSVRSPDGSKKTGGRAVSDQISLMLTKDPMLHFKMWKMTDEINSSKDVFSVYVISASGESQLYTTKNKTDFNTADVFKDFTLDLKPWALESVSIVFEFDSNTSMAGPVEGVYSIYIDDVLIAGTCDAAKVGAGM